MPIIGRVHATPPECYLKDMKVGDKGFLTDLQIVITRKAIFIDKFASVIMDSDVTGEELEDYMSDYVSIKRIGEGLTEKDFEVDLRSSDQCELYIDSMGVYNDFIRRENEFVVFTKFTLKSNAVVPGSYNVPKKTKLQRLKDKLDEAIKREDYPAAIPLRDEIKKIEDKRKLKKEKEKKKDKQDNTKKK